VVGKTWGKGERQGDFFLIRKGKKKEKKV